MLCPCFLYKLFCLELTCFHPFMTVDVNKISLRDLMAMKAAAKKGSYDQVMDKGVTVRPTEIKRFNTDGPGNYAELLVEGFPDPADRKSVV